VSVLMRWLLGAGISGDFELVQIATALGAFAFLPLCQARHGNVIVDSFTTRLSRRARHRLDALWDLTYAALIAIISWRLVLGAFDAFASETTSMGAFLSVVAVATARRLTGSRP
jgi:TRAP-type C4-dicarboxylate transport system permease small subunit